MEISCLSFRWMKRQRTPCAIALSLTVDMFQYNSLNINSLSIVVLSCKTPGDSSSLREFYQQAKRSYRDSIIEGNWIDCQVIYDVNIIGLRASTHASPFSLLARTIQKSIPAIIFRKSIHHLSLCTNKIKNWLHFDQKKFECNASYIIIFVLRLIVAR